MKLQDTMMYVIHDDGTLLIQKVRWQILKQAKNISFNHLQTFLRFILIHHVFPYFLIGLSSLTLLTTMTYCGMNRWDRTS
jgi:hypothetical protein